MPQISLSETDRRRLGCPEWLPVDLSSITNREAVEIRNKLGFPTPSIMRERLYPRPLLDDSGEPVKRTRTGEDGIAEQVEVFDVDPMAWTGLVWIALKRAGIPVDLGELEFEYELVRTKLDEPVEPVPDDPGKADPAPSTSSRSGSRSSGGTSNPKSTNT